MIATARGVAIAAVVAAVSIAAVIFDGLRDAAPVDRAIWPGFAADQVSELDWDWTAQPARPPVLHAVRTGADWQLSTDAPALSARPGPLPRTPGTLADPDAIGEVLAALRGGRWHRLGDAMAVEATLTVVMHARDVRGGEHRVIGFGAPIEGTEQRWIVIDGRGMVVDRWVVRALERDELSLRVRRPFSQLHPGEQIVLATQHKSFMTAPDYSVPGSGGGFELTVEGQPWLRTGSPRVTLLASAVVAPLEQALRALTIVRVQDSRSLGEDAPLRLQIRLSAPTPYVLLGGRCWGASAAEADQLRALVGPWGAGCVERAQTDAIVEAARRLQRPLAEIIERRPVPFEPKSIMLADGATLELSPPRIAGAAADPARVAELLAALAAPAEPVALPAGSATASVAPVGQIRVHSAAGAEFVVELLAGNLLRRSGESLALAPGEGAWAILARSSRALREIATWREQPTAISALQIDSIIYRRGATIGAWTREPASPVNTSPRGNSSVTNVINDALPTAASAAEPVDAKRAAALEALAAELAAPTVIGPIEPVAAIHRVVITVAPPVGAQVIHVLKVGSPISAGCPVMIGDETIALPAATCVQIAPLAR